MTNLVEIKKEAHPGVIEILEDLLQRAKAGKVTYIACVTVEDIIKTNWGGSGNALEVLGSIEFLKNEYLNNALVRP